MERGDGTSGLRFCIDGQATSDRSSARQDRPATPRRRAVWELRKSVGYERYFVIALVAGQAKLDEQWMRVVMHLSTAPPACKIAFAIQG